ncbi:hypothetical protein KM043_017948 [Ampulex compressa]|nr:hypothetical protein KM043_017948 [Ampulex compressa]
MLLLEGIKARGGGAGARDISGEDTYRCAGPRHEVCYYKMGYAARKESRVQQPARTVNRGAQAGSENDIAVVRDSTPYWCTEPRVPCSARRRERRPRTGLHHWHHCLPITCPH